MLELNTDANAFAKVMYNLAKQKQEDEYNYIKEQRYVDLNNIEEQRKSTLNQLKEQTENLGKQGLSSIKILEEQNQREKSNLMAISAASNVGGKTISRLKVAQDIQSQAEEGILKTNLETRLEESLKKGLSINIQAKSQKDAVENQFNQQVKSNQIQELERQVSAIQGFVSMYNMQKQTGDVQEFNLDIK
jgi:hypothetical protein